MTGIFRTAYARGRIINVPTMGTKPVKRVGELKLIIKLNAITVPGIPYGSDKRLSIKFPPFIFFLEIKNAALTPMMIVMATAIIDILILFANGP